MGVWSVPDSPRDLGIDKDSWLEGQKETIEEVLRAFLEEDYRFVILSAPTGSGKSIVGAAIQQIIASAGGIEGTSLVLTHTIQLQEQYLQTLPNCKIAKGRANFLCELSGGSIHRFGELEDFTAADAPCSSGACPEEKDRKPNECAYYRHRSEAAESPMVVANYAYAMNILKPEVFGGVDVHTGMKKEMPNPFRRSLLIADESHLAEKAIVDGAGFDLNLRYISRPLPPLWTREIVDDHWYESTGVWAQWALDAQEEVAQQVDYWESKVKALQEKAKALESAISGQGLSPDLKKEMAQAVGMLQRYNSTLSSLKLLGRLKNKDHQWDEWLVQRNDRTGTVRVAPLWGWTHAMSALWKHFGRVLLMSATPGDPKIEAIKLGIPEGQWKFIERPSIFPVKNRPVYFWPIASLSYKSTDKDWGKIALAIVQIAQSFPDRKGMVHSGSKANARKLVELCNAITNSERFVTHDEGRGEAARGLDAYKRSFEPLVMVSPSFTTGIDIPYLIGWQVIAKVPFASLADDITAKRRSFVLDNGVHFGQQVYNSEAMNTVVQAAGRIVRTPIDSGPTFILDGNYARLHKRAWKPRFYQDAYKELTLLD